MAKQNVFEASKQAGKAFWATCKDAEGKSGPEKIKAEINQQVARKQMENCGASEERQNWALVRLIGATLKCILSKEDALRSEVSIDHENNLVISFQAVRGDEAENFLVEELKKANVPNSHVCNQINVKGDDNLTALRNWAYQTIDAHLQETLKASTARMIRHISEHEALSALKSATAVYEDRFPMATLTTMLNDAKELAKKNEGHSRTA